MALIDPRTNRPFDTSLLKQEIGGASITGVRSPIADHPAERLTPSRLAYLLRASEDGDMEAYLSLAEDMEERDGHYRGVVSKRKWAVSQLPITVAATSNDKIDQKAADLLREVLDSDTMEDDRFDMQDGITKGYSATEIIWDMSGKEWRPARLEWRDPRWFRFDRVDMKTLRLLGDNGTEEDLLPYKWIVHMPKSKSGIPIRGGIARPASWCYLFKSMDLAAWVQFVEMFGHPIRIGKWGPGAKEEDKQTLLRALQAIGRNFAAAIPESMMIELIEAKSSGNSDLHQKHADWLDRQISKAVLGSTAGTDAIAGGHAVGKEHRDVEADIERSDARQLGASLMRGLARPLIDLNFGRDVRTPRIIIARPDSEDLKALMELTGQMVDRGMRVGVSVVRDKLGWEDPGEGEAVLQPLNKSATPAEDGAPGQERLVNKPDSQVKQETAAAQLLKLFTAAAEAPPADSLDALAEAELQDWEKMVTPIVDPVRKLLEEVSNLDEFLARLPALAETIGSEALTESLSRSSSPPSSRAAAIFLSMAKVEFRKLAPDDQVRYLKAKGFKIEETWGWKDWKAPVHAGAFTVAKSTGFDILNDIYDAALKAKAEGVTPAMFGKQLTPILQDKGWWGRKAAVNPNTGQEEDVQLGSPQRLRLIYDVNMRVAHAAGAWSRVERLKDDRPWLCYSCILDRRLRPQHRAWHGTVLRWDDPFWRTHYPPNGWRCRCRVRQFSDDDLSRYGLKPTTDPAFSWHEVQNKRTGEVVLVPAGIDPGWAYNPGRTAFDVHAARALAGKLDGLAPGLAQAASEASARFVAEPLARGFKTWVAEIIAPGATAAGEAIPFGIIDRGVLAALRTAKPSVVPLNSVLSIGDKQIQHLARTAKANAASPGGLAKAMPVEDLKRLPELMKKPTAVYLDRGDLIYRVPSSVKGREGKIVVSLDYGADERVRGGNRVISRSARIKSAGLVDASNFGGLTELR